MQLGWGMQGGRAPTVPGEAFGEDWLQRQHGSPSTYSPTWLQRYLVSCMKVCQLKPG